MRNAGFVGTDCFSVEHFCKKKKKAFNINTHHRVHTLIDVISTLTTLLCESDFDYKDNLGSLMKKEL